MGVGTSRASKDFSAEISVDSACLPYRHGLRFRVNARLSVCPTVRSPVAACSSAQTRRARLVRGPKSGTGVGPSSTVSRQKPVPSQISAADGSASIHDSAWSKLGALGQRSASHGSASTETRVLTGAYGTDASTDAGSRIMKRNSL